MQEKNPQLLTITGIANEDLFIQYVSSLGTVDEKMIFPDHHAYSVIEMHNLVEKYSTLSGEYKFILTTAKDAMKLKQFNNLDEEIKKAMFYIPVFVEFHENEEKSFNQNINSYVRNNKPDNILYTSKSRK